MIPREYWYTIYQELKDRYEYIAEMKKKADEERDDEEKDRKIRIENRYKEALQKRRRDVVNKSVNSRKIKHI